MIMDYLTSPITRSEIRTIAKGIRVLFKCKNKYRFDVVGAFESLPKMFPNVCCEVIEDDDFSEIAKGVPSACIPGFDGSYRILVRKRSTMAPLGASGVTVLILLMRFLIISFASLATSQS